MNLAGDKIRVSFPAARPSTQQCRYVRLGGGLATTFGAIIGCDATTPHENYETRATEARLGSETLPRFTLEIARAAACQRLEPGT